VTQWIELLKAGDPAAAEPLWERYFEQLVRRARAKLTRRPRRAADEEDVAISAFDSFCRGAAQGRFPLLSDRDNLWPLLIKITERKAIDLIQHNNRLRRRPAKRKVMGESEWPDGEGSEGGRGIDQLPGPDPSPDFIAVMTDACRDLLDRLEDDTLRSIALQKLAGYTYEEIAEPLGLCCNTIGRKVKLIRKRWKGACHE
jgi:DNA-directed RNA polymerase specialized sigma24 family protein